jgi:hypothetical protein
MGRLLVLELNMIYTMVNGTMEQRVKHALRQLIHRVKVKMTMIMLP